MRQTLSRFLQGLVALVLCTAASWPLTAAGECDQGEYTQSFRLGDCSFLNAGRTPFFVLEPGYWLRLEGMEKDDLVEVTITVLRDTQLVNGVKTRLVEERERGSSCRGHSFWDRATSRRSLPEWPSIGGAIRRWA